MDEELKRKVEQLRRAYLCAFFLYGPQSYAVSKNRHSVIKTLKIPALKAWYKKHVSLLVGPSPGVRWYQELQLRLFCRQVLLDPWPNQPECQFWLIQLLKPWPMVSQAHLLFILYGPLLPEGKITFILTVTQSVRVCLTLWQHVNWNDFYFVCIIWPK